MRLWLSELLSEEGQAAQSEIWPSNESGETAADGAERATDKRTRNKAEASSHEAPLGEASLSEESTPIFEAA